MQFRFKWIYLILWGLTTYAQALNIEDCYRLALANSETLSSADIRALIEEDRTREIWGYALPQLSASADFITRGDAKDIHHHNRTKNAKVSLVFPIYNFGGASNAIYAQEKRQESASFDVETTQQKVLYATHQAYYQLLEVQKIAMILKESAERLNRQMKVTQDFMDQGLVHQNELLLIDVELSLIQQELLEAQNRVAVATIKLNRLIGREMDLPLELEDIYERLENHQDLRTLIFHAKNNHPLLRSLQAQIEAARFTYEAEKGKLYPAIYGYTNYSTTNDYALPYRHGLDAGIGMQLSLYDGGTTWAKLRRLKKEVSEIEQRYVAEEKNIELSIRTAYLTLENTIHKIPVALKSVGLAERNLTNTQEHFAEGLITNVEVITDQEKLIRARYNYYQSLYQYHQAKADLVFTAGVSIYSRGCKNNEE
ncbi:MAG: hypothetical protein BGO14_02840 [Chlamydiales bacterium 38-26]|nr:TolC family protein [Chlamydiales bacterium]OJV09285.1 MAG: hypothetical protein BGO14_02840 [Chlamydiales bacterium 38-26]